MVAYEPSRLSWNWHFNALRKIAITHKKNITNIVGLTNVIPAKLVCCTNCFSPTPSFSPSEQTNERDCPSMRQTLYLARTASPFRLPVQALEDDTLVV